jgi:hypothetical protein
MKESPPADFPKQESFIDCAGREINFALKCRRGPTGWIASGVERVASASVRNSTAGTCYAWW